MNQHLTIIVDADAIVAQSFVDDPNHKKAVTALKNIHGKNARMIYPASAILEAATVLGVKLGVGATAYATTLELINSHSEIAQVDKKTIKIALAYFSPHGSKRNTLFDCVVLALAKEHNANAIFSFDKFYKKAGFKLLSDL